MAPPVDINYLAVLVSAVAGMAIGAVWYGPLFGKYWMKLMNFDKKKLNTMKAKNMMSMSYGIAFIGSIVMAYILAHFVDYVQATTYMDGIMVGFWAWLGFVATVTLGMVLWEGKSWNLYLLLNAYQLVSLAVMGVILTLWV